MMTVCCCSVCKYVDLLNYADEKKCCRCGSDYLDLAISSVKWNELTNDQMKELITNKIQEYENKKQSEVLKQPVWDDEDITIGQRNALGSAKSYLDYDAFSYVGLVEQLEYEKYSKEDALYAVDNCGADWNEQAAKCAENYLSYSSFSRDGLIEQLLYEGFTSEQAEYGVSQIGY